ncbi:restriction endonuclease subunit S [Shewanella baltica]|uniref:restriction endonuclease subunit S n=1 Tax=Shewanella baltica TaxID=62322 RepID=UPI003D7902D1
MSNLVPDGWEAKKFAEAITLSYGKSPKEILVEDGIYPVVGTGGITGHTNSYLHEGYTSVIGRKGSINNPSFIFSRFWAIDTTYFASNYTNTNPKWFFYLLQNIDLTQYNEASGVPSLNRDTLYSIPFISPPLSEQQKIAAILTSVDDVIEKTQAQIDKLKDLKSGMMQELLTKGVGIKQGDSANGKSYIPHSEFKDSAIGRIPKSWEVVKFKDIFHDYKYGPRFSSKDYNPTGNVKTIRGTDLSSNGVIKYKQVPVAKLDDKLVDQNSLKSGDLVMITTADCGATAVFESQPLPYIASAYAIRLTPKERVNSKYINYFMQTSDALSQVDSFIRKGTVANLPGSDVMSIVLALPAIQEQNKIVSILGQLDSKIVLKQEVLINKKNLKKALMQDLLTGKVRVKVAEQV